MEEVARLSQGPKLVLATLPSLQAGMARQLFVEWAGDPRNLFLFTQQAEVHPFAAYGHYSESFVSSAVESAMFVLSAV